MLHIHLLISGLVTGIGFRYFVERKASDLGLGGWVRNTFDDKVEAVFEGEEEKVKKMIELCQEGPAGAIVKKVEILERKKTEKAHKEFQILFS